MLENIYRNLINRTITYLDKMINNFYNNKIYYKLIFYFIDYPRQ